MDITMILDRNYPGTNWSGSAQTYATLQWKDPTPKPTLLELQTQWVNIQLGLVKKTQIQQLSLHAKSIVEGGFASSSTGTLLFYDSAMEDQINLLGAVAGGVDLYYATRTTLTALTKTYTLHTASQIRQVMDDGKTFKTQILMQFNTRRTQIEACTTVADVLKVVW